MWPARAACAGRKQRCAQPAGPGRAHLRARAYCRTITAKAALCSAGRAWPRSPARARAAGTIIGKAALCSAGQARSRSPARARAAGGQPRRAGGRGRGAHRVHGGDAARGAGRAGAAAAGAAAPALRSARVCGPFAQAHAGVSRTMQYQKGQKKLHDGLCCRCCSGQLVALRARASEHEYPHGLLAQPHPPDAPSLPRDAHSASLCFFFWVRVRVQAWGTYRWRARR